VGIGNSIALVGGLVHLVHQGLMKITLFFCAGIWAERLGIHRIVELDGVGRRMPLVGASFTVAALGMIGLPPIAGFISKWYIGTGALAAGQPWIIPVLMASTLLNAGYFLPIVHRLWFREPPADAPAAQPLGRAALLAMTLPPILTATMACGAGIFAATPLSPLSWVSLIVERGPAR
jgi:multicomponent Na+:H+ antiporter subunit D